MSLKSGVTDISRVSHIVGVFFRQGLGYFIQKYGLKLHLPFQKRLAVHRYRKPELPEVRFRKAFETLGGTYIKLGQLLSLRPDLVPDSYCREFSKLQDEVPPFSFEKVKQIVEKELGRPMNSIFTNFEEKPIGSASIGQVHTATLKNGSKVVVKVQRPGIKEVFKADIDIMYYFARKLEKSERFGKYSPLTIVKEFERYTKNELNYLFESKNIQKFYENLKTTSFVKIPKVYFDYCTPNVLITEFIKGKKLSELIRKGERFNKKKVITHLTRASLKQIFDQGMFHADLHPGNILVLDGGKIAILDFGIVGKLTPYLKKEGIKLYVALINKDIDTVTKQLLKIARPTAETDMEGFRKEVDDIISGWHGTELREVRATHMMHQLFDTCIAHDMKLPVDMILFAKAMVTSEGTCLMINPRFNFVEEAKHYLPKHVEKKIISAESFKLFLKRSEEIAEVLNMIPSETLSVLERLKRGIIKIDIEDTDLKRLALDLDRSSNRLSYALVLAALIIAGAVLIHAEAGPYYKGLPVSAIVLYIIAVFMGLTLVLSILKEGALWR